MPKSLLALTLIKKSKAKKTGKKKVLKSILASEKTKIKTKEKKKLKKKIKLSSASEKISPEKKLPVPKKAPRAQSGAVPYLITDGKLHIMLVTVLNGNVWTVPKGNIAKGLTAAESAAKEALEEAGVRGICDPKPLGKYEYHKMTSQTPYKVQVFPLKIEKVLPQWKESALRARRFFSLEDALLAIREKSLQRILMRLAKKTAKEEEGDDES